MRSLPHCYKNIYFERVPRLEGGGAVDWGTALQAGRSRVRFPMVSLDFFIAISFWPHYGPGVDSASNRNEHQEYFLGVKVAGA